MMHLQGGQQPEQAESSFSSRFVKVSKRTLYGESGPVASRPARDGPVRASSSSSVNPGSSGPRAPATPTHNRPSRVSPSSPTIGESQQGPVVHRSAGGAKGQGGKDMVHCHCCFATSKLPPYSCATLCMLPA